jgi:hypothetical protein
MNDVDEYWNRPPVEIGRLPLGIEGEQYVFLIRHEAREECGREHRELGLGVMRAKDGAVIEREYVHAKAGYFVPDLVLTLAITNPNAAPGEQLGTVEDVHSRGRRTDRTRSRYVSLADTGIIVADATP